MSDPKPRRSTPSRERKSSVCAVPSCGRPNYARGLCQTHHRQMQTTGQLIPIRPYQKRGTETVKFAGLRLTPRCAELIGQKATRDGTSRGAAIAAILEEYLLRHRPNG